MILRERQKIEHMVCFTRPRCDQGRVGVEWSGVASWEGSELELKTRTINRVASCIRTSETGGGRWVDAGARVASRQGRVDYYSGELIVIVG